jgi:hypothetical protein
LLRRVMLLCRRLKCCWPESCAARGIVRARRPRRAHRSTRNLDGKIVGFAQTGSALVRVAPGLLQANAPQLGQADPTRANAHPSPTGDGQIMTIAPWNPTTLT